MSMSEKRGITKSEIYEICAKVYAKYQYPGLSSSSDILFTRLFIYKMAESKGHDSETTSPVEKKRVHLFFMFVPHIKFQVPIISGMASQVHNKSTNIGL